MRRNYDLCSGRDAWGRLMYTRLPVGVARTGMFVRLFGGVFLKIERVETGGRVDAPICTAVEVLDRIWEGKSNV